MNKKILGIVLIAIIVSPSLSLADTMPFHPSERVPDIRIVSAKPWYEFFFNDVFGQPKITYTISNEDTRGKPVLQGVFVVEIAIDKGDGSIPGDTDFKMLDYFLVDNIQPGQNESVDVLIGDRWPAQRYILRRSFYLYWGNSPIHQARTDLTHVPEEVMAAWDQDFRTRTDWQQEMAALGCNIFTENIGTFTPIITKNSFRDKIIEIIIGIIGAIIVWIFGWKAINRWMTKLQARLKKYGRWN